MSTLESFAKAHRLKTASVDGETIIPGRQGQIYERDESERQLAVMFQPPATLQEPVGHWCPKVWGNFKRAAVAIGMRVVQNGDSEGCLEFDHRDRTQVKLAIKIAKVRSKRTQSPERIAKFLAAVKRPRLTEKIAV